MSCSITLCSRHRALRLLLYALVSFSLEFVRHTFNKLICRFGQIFRGAMETRTPNPQNANLVLYQLSYNPKGYGPEWT